MLLETNDGTNSDALMPCQEGDVFINCVKVFLLGVVVDALPLGALDALVALVALVVLVALVLIGAALASLPQAFTNRRYIEGSAETGGGADADCTPSGRRSPRTLAPSDCVDAASNRSARSSVTMYIVTKGGVWISTSRRDCRKALIGYGPPKMSSERRGGAATTSDTP